MSLFLSPIRISLILIITASLSACINSEGIAPESKLTLTNQIDVGTTIKAAQKDAGWPQHAWWNAYGDQQLNNLMQQALKNNPSLAEAQARVRAATAISDQMNAVNLPQIGAAASARRKRWPTDYFYGPGELGGTTSWDNTSVLHMDYDPDFWGKNTKMAEQALDRVHLNVAQSRMAELDLEVNLVRAYIMFAFHYAQRDLALNTIKQYQEILTITQSRWEAGLATQIELNTAKTQLADSKMQLNNYDDAVAISKHELAALTGQGPGEAEQINEPHLKLQQDIALPAVLPADLIGRRPDVVASRWLVAAQNKGIDVAKAAFYPNINLSAALGFMAVNGGPLSLFSSPKFTYGVGPAISLPIFDAGQLRGQLREADAQYDAAVAAYNASIINALKEIANGVVNFKTAGELAQNASDAVAAAEQSSHTAEAAYKRGLVNYIAVAQAQIKLYQQQQLQQKSIALQLGAYGMVATALGGGLITNETSPQPQQLQYQDKHS